MRLGKSTLKFNGESVNCRLYGQIQNLFKLSLTENVVIPPSSEMIIPTKIVGDQPLGKRAVVKDNCPSLSKKGILVGKSVFDPNKCEIPVRVFNVSDTPQTIYKNTVTTECEIVLDSSVVSFQDQSCDEMDAQTLNKIDLFKVPQKRVCS